MADPNDDPFFDRIMEAIRSQPVPEGPPDDVRRRVLDLGENAMQPMVASRSTDHLHRADWLVVAAVAAAILVAIDLGWVAYVNAATPVAWFHGPRTERWHVLYDTTYVGVGRPNAEFLDPR